LKYKHAKPVHTEKINLDTNGILNMNLSKNKLYEDAAKNSFTVNKNKLLKIKKYSNELFIELD